jgi:hypothetical protein
MNIVLSARLRVFQYLVPALVLFLCLAHYSLVRAELLVYASPSAATPGGGGAFDIVLFNNEVNGGTTFQVGGFSSEVYVSAVPGVTFTGVSQNTHDQYIFWNNPDSPTLSWTLADAVVTVTDLSGMSPYYQEIAPGASMGLAHILYEMNPNVPLNGPQSLIAVMFTLGGTTISGADGVTALPIGGPYDGTIEAVPEVDPSSSLSAISLVAGVLAMIERRRRSTSFLKA